MTVRILGGGIAGCTAAMAALAEGVDVEILERSKYPRHKVCGEFLSPEIAPVLDRLGLSIENAFRVRRMAVHLGASCKTGVLPEPAYGLSRFALDHLLWTTAVQRGARHVESGEPTVIAAGRHLPGQAHEGDLFGFKAHFGGPSDDAVELFFFDGGYVGINCIEGGRTNVCGLAPKRVLQACGFDPDALMPRSRALELRVAPLSRAMDWMFTGPLHFTQRWSRRDVFLAGDSLSFIDPFTGSGMLCAAVTGSLAGSYAARGLGVEEYLRACRANIRRPFAFSSLLRTLAGTSAAGQLLRFVPAQCLFRLTRPQPKSSHAVHAPIKTKPAG